MSEADLARDLEAELLSDLQATLNAVRPDRPRPEPARSFGGTRYGGDLFPPPTPHRAPPPDPYYLDAVEPSADAHDASGRLFDPEPANGADGGATQFAPERHYDPESLFDPEPHEAEPEEDPKPGLGPERHYDPAALFDPEPELAPAPNPAAADSSAPRPLSPTFRPRALPRALTERALGARGGNGSGPAYNPGALGFEQRPSAASQRPAAAIPFTGAHAAQDPELESDAIDEHPFDAVARQSLDAQPVPAPRYEPLFPFEREYDLPPLNDAAFVAKPEARQPASLSAPPIHEQTDEPVHRFGYAEEDIGAAPARRGRWVVTTIAFLVFVSLAATAMIFLRGGTIGAGGPPLITADAGPIRIAPEVEPAPEAPPEGGVVFNRLDEGAVPIAPTLLPATEAPVIVEPPAPPADGITELIGGPVAATPVAPIDEPRSVRTVTVLPDGTIVNNQVVGPNGEVTTPANQGADAAVPPSPPALNATRTDPALAAIPAGNGPAAAEEPAPIADAAAPVPAEAIAAAPTEPVPDTIAAGRPIPPGVYVQLSSQTTEAAALADIRDFRARIGNLVEGLNAVVQTGVVGGIERFRSQFGPLPNEGAALTLCANIRAAGLQCIVARN